MKKFLFYLVIVSLLFAAGCQKDDVPAVKPVALNVQVSYDTDQSSLNLSLQDIEVEISNVTNGQSYTAKTDANGLATFESVAPGNYVVTAARTFTAEEYSQASGISAAEDVTFNASENAGIQKSQTLQLTLIPGRIGNLVFKQLYYAGSDISTGAAFRDEFVEIYNNSNDTIYVDSLYFGNTLSNNKRVSDGATTFDWSQSVGMPSGIGDPSKDYIYARYLFMIPGSGKDHPVAPGKSIIIAQTALDHTAPYKDNSGKVQGITDPAKTVDLSQADFETYLVDYNREKDEDPSTFKPFRWDLDNPDVANVEVIWVASGKDWVLDATGREDFFMFKTNENVSTWPSYPDPTVTTVDNTTKMYKQIPVKYVIDAVEIIPPIPAKAIPKRLPVSLDGQGTFVAGGQYSSQSLIRKTTTTLNGRIILQDTNNSANDFDTKTKADPSKTAASFTVN